VRLYDTDTFFVLKHGTGVTREKRRVEKWKRRMKNGGKQTGEGIRMKYEKKKNQEVDRRK
jgi:hypothetical protein